MGSMTGHRNRRGIVVSLDGHLVKRQSADISIEDWGFRYGWGAFETIRVTQCKPVFLARHLKRLTDTAGALLLSDKDESPWWQREIRKVLAYATAGEWALNLYWTRGEAPNFRGRRIICLRPLPPHRRAEARVWVAPWQIGPGVPGVGAKTLAYLPYTFSSICAQAAGFTDAVLVNKKGRIADGSSASVFLINKGKLVTPPLTDGALPGVTRGVVLELAKKLGIPARVAPITISRLHTSEGVFLTSVLRGLREVKRVDSGRIAMSPEARQVFARLNQAYEQAVAEDLAGYGT